MSAPLAARAEVLKLGRVLRRDPEQLAYLEVLEASDLRALREQVTGMLFSSHQATFSRLAAASRLLPMRVVATIGERAFGAVLAARITGELDPERAVELAQAMPTEFIADVAVELDPRRAGAVIARIPPERIGEISRELIRREEYVTMGRFVGHLQDGAIRAALAELDDRSLLQVAFVLESKEGLEDLVALLPDSRRESLIATAARHGMWEEALDLLGHLSESSRRSFAHAKALDRAGVLEAIVQTAAENRLWAQLLPLVPELPDPARDRVVAAAAELPSEQLQELYADARGAGLEEELRQLTELLGRSH